MTIVRCDKPTKESSKCKTAVFPLKSHALRLRKVCYKVSLCENCQRQSCKAFISLSICAKNDCWRTSPFNGNFGPNWPRWSYIEDFRSIFARGASAVTPSEKVQLTLIGSPLRAFQWAQDKHRTLSPWALTPKGAKNAVSKICTIICNNSSTLRDGMSVI